MPIPVTFSAAGDAYTPSPEDRLRDGVYLMLMADNVNRREYSFVPDDATKGVRIYCDVEGRDADNEDRIIVPQQVVVIGFGATRFNRATGNAGTKVVSVNIGLLEPPDTEFVYVDVVTPPITVLAKLARVEEILTRGTLYTADMTTGRGRVVDPYATPRNVDGTYDADAITLIAEGPPAIIKAAPRNIRRKPWSNERDFFEVDPLKDVAVLYSLIATYDVAIANTENQDGE